MINGIDFEKLNNGAYFEFHEKFNRMIGQKDVNGLEIRTEFTAYRHHLDVGITERIETLEKMDKMMGWEVGEERKKVLNALLKVVEGCYGHPMLPARFLGEGFKNALKIYRNINLMPYLEQTQRIHNLLNELLKDLKNSKYMKRYGLTAWMEDLNNYNERFDSYVKSTKYKKELEREEFINKTRRVVDELYRAMVKKLDAHAVLGHPMVNAEFVNAINALVEKYTVCD
jgi:hypothetical protein